MKYNTRHSEFPSISGIAVTMETLHAPEVGIVTTQTSPYYYLSLFTVLLGIRGLIDRCE